MNCDRATRNLLRLDNGRQPRGKTARHLADCPECRAFYLRLQRALETISEPQADETPDAALTARIMQSVRRHADGHVRSRAEYWTDYGKWIACGALIVFGTAALPYSPAVLRSLPQSSVDATLAVAYGVMLSAYIGVFIGTHLDDLARILRRDQPG